MTTTADLQDKLVTWFNELTPEERTIPASDVRLFRTRMVETDGITLLVIGDAEISEFDTIVHEALFVWKGAVDVEAVATTASFVEITAPPRTTDAIVEGTANRYFTEERVRQARLSGFKQIDSPSGQMKVSAADSIVIAISKLASLVTKAFNRSSHTGTQHMSTVTDLQTTVTRLEAQSGNPMKTITGTTYTLQDSDNGYFIEFTSSSAITVTIPAHTSGLISSAQTAGTPTFHLCQAGTGKITVVPASGVTLVKPASMSAATLEREAVITVKRRSSNSYRVYGLLAAA